MTEYNRRDTDSRICICAKCLWVERDQDGPRQDLGITQEGEEGGVSPTSMASWNGNVHVSFSLQDPEWYIGQS